MTLFVDLSSPENTAEFNDALFYRKSSVVQARKTIVPETLDTVLSNGLVETSRDVPVGYWIVTNPTGEKYAIEDSVFTARYEPSGADGFYRAKGVIKAFKNPHGVKVQIIAPWGEPQFGDKDCWFAAAVDENKQITGDRYIIGGNEFKVTYGLY